MPRTTKTITFSLRSRVTPFSRANSISSVVGSGLKEICKELNDLGVTNRGKRWYKGTLHYVLRNEAYTGAAVWGKTSKDEKAQDPVRVEGAWPALVSRELFDDVQQAMSDRAPKVQRPARVGSKFLLSGLLKCGACGRPYSAQGAKSGQFAYYICGTLFREGAGTCSARYLNAPRLETFVVEKIRSNILTEGSITELVKVVDEEMDGIAQDQRKRLRIIEDELEDVKRRLGRIWNVIETSDVEMADASDRIKEHRERKERLEDAAADARAILSERRAHLDDVKTISAYAKDMRDFLNESELTERRAFIESFVKEIIVMPGDALMRYTIPISQSTPKAAVLVGGRFGCDRVRSGGSTGGRATSTLIAGSIPHRWAYVDGR